MAAEQKPTNPQKKSLFARLRGNSIIFVITFVYLFALGGAALIIESFYLAKKWELVQQKLSNYDFIKTEAGDPIDPGRVTNTLRLYVDAYFEHLRAATPEQAERIKLRNMEKIPELRDRAMKELTELIDEAPVIVALELRPIGGDTLLSVERWDRISEQHDITNSLLTRSFHKSAKQTFSMPIGGKVESVAVYYIHFTTPKDDPDIQELTLLYWKILALTVTLLTAVYFILLKFVFLPLRRVVVYMQRRDEQQSAVIPNPSNLLERAYNNLARDAALTRLSKDLRERISAQGLSYAHPMLEQIPEILSCMVGVPTAQVWTFHRGAKNQWLLDHTFTLSHLWFQEEPFAKDITAAVNDHDPMTEADHWRCRLFTSTPGEGRSWQYFCDILDARQEHLWLFVVQIPPRGPGATSWWMDYFTRIGQELRYALNSVEDQRRLILQEKSKANISLSRNLGHDLTNIIATTKLELMTVRTILGQGPEALQANEMKQKIFEESLQALLNNTRFLQEIVNLYRSFSYLQKPKFEETHVPGLVRDVVQLYQLTLSKAFRMEVNVEEEMPQARVEPRLLRLALFNLLTNAVDAIKRSGSEDKPEGLITINTTLLSKEKMIQISVEDTGPGIRDNEGKLVTPDQISEVFRLGYTTKERQEGEGLGLNWVQTIVREFHGGDVFARNREKEGAAFILRIPIEHPEGLGKSNTDSQEIELVQASTKDSKG